ncbi:unnamed protein product [Mesocestoides corti]|uniref:DLH domain-containing protein n=1 Tax=Mesocestoides corti TaxID=53468 RepID=A0A0R3U592_MESCO|nr:unnamed protein product [Mesocestoides corti]
MADSSSVRGAGPNKCCDSEHPTVAPLSYKTRGKEVALANGDQAYLVSPAGLTPANLGIVLVYDAFGFEIVNTRRFADMLADQANAHVIMPDFFRGKPWPLTDFPPKQPSAFSEWLEKNGSWSVVFPLLRAANTYVQGLLPEGDRDKMGILGFSWGGKQVLRACSDKTLGYLAGVSIHGYMITPDDAKNISVPLFFMPSGEDPPIDPLKAILDKRPFGDKCRYYTFTEERHGFASARGDLNDQGTLEAINQTIALAAAFFKENLREGTSDSECN